LIKDTMAVIRKIEFAAHTKAAKDKKYVVLCVRSCGSLTTVWFPLRLPPLAVNLQRAQAAALIHVRLRHLFCAMLWASQSPFCALQEFERLPADTVADVDARNERLTTLANRIALTYPLKKDARRLAQWVFSGFNFAIKDAPKK
jgi:hypothetical protein